MASKVFKKNFARDFKGISGECASIEESDGTVNRALNYEYAVGNSLRGRVGCQVISDSKFRFMGIFPYIYNRTQDQYDIVYQVAAGAHPNETPSLGTLKTQADGATIQKLVGINQQLWVQETMDITITQTVAGTYTWYSYVNGSHLHFVIKKTAVQILDSDIGDGIGGLSGVDTIYALLGVINALADLSVAYTRGVCPPFAIATGAATVNVGPWNGPGTIYRVAVNAGHTFSTGDIITFPTTPIVGGMVWATTAGTIDYIGPLAQPANGDVLGYMGQTAATFPVSTVSSETSGGAMVISFPYWRLILDGDGCSSTLYGNPFGSAYSLWSTKTTDSFYSPPTYVNADGCLYIGTAGKQSDGILRYYNNILKFDGKTVTKVGAGLAPTITIGAVAAGALTGTYKYKAFMRRYDAQGNISDGPVSSVSTVVLAANNQSLTPTFDLYGAAFGWQARGCYKNTTETRATGLFNYIDLGAANTAFVQPGDFIITQNNTAVMGGGITDLVTGVTVKSLTKTYITGFDATNASISLASGGFQITDNTAMSTSLTVVILRTTAGGNQFYVLCELPANGAAGGGVAITDNATDANLSAGEQYIEVPIGKEHNHPPAASLICLHQGGLCVSKGVINQVTPTGVFTSCGPNTVAFSSADGIEYFPTASNSFEVPSSQAGGITAIASDTIDRLAVFKDKAYYDIAGDLDGGTFSVNVRNEGDYGVSSQASLVRINNALIGICKNGWVKIQDGFLDPYTYKDVSARLINQAYQFAWAVAVNDYFNRQYICTIPQISGEPVSFVMDYSRNKIIPLERSYATKLDSAGGMAMIGDTLYHLSTTSPYGVFRRLYRFNGDSPSGAGNGDSFIDNTEAINYIYESQPETLGEPAQLKTPQKARIWSLPNDYVVDGWVPFTFRFETGASPIASFIGSGGTNNTNAVDSFLTANDVFKDIELVKQKVNFYIVRITVNTIRQAPFITGYEIEYADNYKKEDLQK